MRVINFIFSPSQINNKPIKAFLLSNVQIMDGDLTWKVWECQKRVILFCLWHKFAFGGRENQTQNGKIWCETATGCKINYEFSIIHSNISVRNLMSSSSNPPTFATLLRVKLIFYDAKSIKKRVGKIPMGTAAKHYHYKLRRWSLWNYCRNTFSLCEGVMKADDIKSIGKNYILAYGVRKNESSMSLGRARKNENGILIKRKI